MFHIEFMLKHLTFPVNDFPCGNLVSPLSRFWKYGVKLAGKSFLHDVTPFV